MAGAIDMGVAVVLGALQGATEFLPVSSSGHIALGEMLFGIADRTPLSFAVLLHVGTLAATIAVFLPDLGTLGKSTLRGFAEPRALLASEDGQLMLGIVIATIPTGIVGLLFRDSVEELSRVAWVVGIYLLGSAAAALSTRRGGGEANVLLPSRALILGFAQSLALLPGLSRSGTTIAVAMALGLTGPAAFRFSFLLSLPAVLGATILELRDVDGLIALGPGAIAGIVTSFLVGYAALRVLRVLVDRGRFWTFAVYLVPLGIGTIVWGLTR